MMQHPRDPVLQRAHEAIVDTERARERGRGETSR
jgi:hypothetical protein